ncbi:MAG: DUF2993 domain-containing protein [Cyanobacteria bacterium J06623_4]
MTEEANKRERRGSRIIGKVLPPAAQLWLRSQVEQVEQLAINLDGSDRQILSGYLPGVTVSAKKALYKGIAIQCVDLSATDIRINIGQVVRGKPLRLLKKFPVQGDAEISAADLDASLDSPLLMAGLNDFWRSLIEIPAFAQSVQSIYGQLPVHPDVIVQNPQLRLGEACLGLSFYPAIASSRDTAASVAKTAERPIILGTGLTVVDRHYLQLNSPCWLTSLDDMSTFFNDNDDNADTEPIPHQPMAALEGFRWNLGKETQLTQLSLQPDQIRFCGQVMVIP